MLHIREHTGNSERTSKKYINFFPILRGSPIILIIGEEKMFNEQRLKRYAKIVGIESDQAETVLRNQAKYLRVNPDLLLKSFTVVDQAKQESEAKKAELLKYTSKNLLIIKYKDEIVKLYNDGFGYLKISKAMKVNHNATISKSAIENFIKSNGIERAE